MKIKVKKKTQKFSNVLLIKSNLLTMALKATANLGLA